MNCAIATVRPLATATPSGAAASGSSSRTSSGFSASKYVDDRWEAKILTAAAQGTPLTTLIAAIKLNPTEAGKQYGYRDSGPYNFPVQVQGVVEKVDTESRAGTLLLKPDEISADIEVRIAIGPVIRGTAIRDGSGVIPFSDFVNQIEYADVAEELNKRVAENVLKPLDLAALQGKTIQVQGFFTLGDAAKIVITPVKIDVK
jgi:predicted lipoprotein